MTINLDTVGVLIVISSIVALSVGILKDAARTASPQIEDTAGERWVLRLLDVLLGVAYAALIIGFEPVHLALGALAGAASEVVYRWVMADLLPSIGDSLTR